MASGDGLAAAWLGAGEAGAAGGDGMWQGMRPHAAVWAECGGCMGLVGAVPSEPTHIMVCQP